MKRSAFVLAVIFFFQGILMSSESGFELKPLNRDNAIVFSKLALKCVGQEFPNKPGHVMKDKSDVLRPGDMHPAFYGCFDWHSAVHGHWLLVKVLRLFPDVPNAEIIRKTLNRNLTGTNLLEETEYFKMDHHKSFERTYGWAWLLKLTEELHGWDDSDGKKWRKNLEPLEQLIVKRYMDFFPKQNYPIRKGDHPNTAFGLAFAIDYAVKVENKVFEDFLKARSLDYFFSDIDCPGEYEPDGDDFFSPCLMEADLMKRVLKKEDFRKWFRYFLPGLSEEKPEILLTPATVTDRSDGKLVHLDGLNMTRAWCMAGIARSLDGEDPVKRILLKSASAHGESALKSVMSGDYAGEHWLASFAVYLLSNQ